MSLFFNLFSLNFCVCSAAFTLLLLFLPLLGAIIILEFIQLYARGATLVLFLFYFPGSLIQLMLEHAAHQAAHGLGDADACFG